MADQGIRFSGRAADFATQLGYKTAHLSITHTKEQAQAFVVLEGRGCSPYHAPLFFLTHYEREPLMMEGGTTFFFVIRGIEEALRLAKQAAGDKDVKIGGGVSTVRQYLQAELLDSLHLALSPVALGQGEAPLSGIDLRALGFSVTEHHATEHSTHVVLAR